MHYVALFACYGTKEGKTALPLLAFAPLLDETSFSASTHRDYIESSLQLYSKSLESLLFLTGDNCSTNKAVADLIGVLLVGCASHRLNMACKKAYEQAEDNLKKISSLMSKLSSLKNAGLRRQLTSVYPVKQNATRWISTFHMVECYRKLKDLMPSMYDFDRTILDCSLSAREDHDLLGFFNGGLFFPKTGSDEFNWLQKSLLFCKNIYFFIDISQKTLDMKYI